MDQQKIDMYIMMNRKYFPSGKIMVLRERLQYVDDNKFALISSVELKDPTTSLLLSLFLGGLGVDRFILGNIGMGLLKLFTAGLCGILTIVDWFCIQSKTRELNFDNVMELL